MNEENVDTNTKVVNSACETDAMRIWATKHQYKHGVDTFNREGYLDNTCYVLPVSFYHDGVDLGSLGRNSSDGKLVTGHYARIVCLPVEARSRLDCIFAVAFARSRDLKVPGARDRLLSEFWEEIRMLHKGVEVYCAGFGNVIVKGGLYMCTGDQPAQAILTGTNETTGKSYRQCRHCMWGEDDKKRDIARQLKRLNARAYCEKTPERTTRGIHTGWKKLKEMEDAGAEERDKTKLKQKTGVVAKPMIPKDLRFDLVMGTPQDVMHNILEGPLAWTMRWLLHQLAKKDAKLMEKICTYVEDFGKQSMKRYRNDAPRLPRHLFFPPPSTLYYGAGMAGMKAVQVWNTAVALPWALKRAGVTRKINPWVTVFLLLVQLTHKVMLRSTSREHEKGLEALIEKYNESLFVAGSKDDLHLLMYRPKNHFITRHTKKTLQVGGPARSTFCAREEAKHGDFKRFMARCSNWKDPSRDCMAYELRRKQLLRSVGKRNWSSFGNARCTRFVPLETIGYVKADACLSGAEAEILGEWVTRQGLQNAINGLRIVSSYTSASGGIFTANTLARIHRNTHSSSHSTSVVYVRVGKIVLFCVPTPGSSQPTNVILFIGKVWKAMSYDEDLCARKLCPVKKATGEYYQAAFAIPQIDVDGPADVFVPLGEKEIPQGLTLTFMIGALMHVYIRLDRYICICVAFKRIYVPPYSHTQEEVYT
eukprot:Rmarinus@m.29771